MIWITLFLFFHSVYGFKLSFPYGNNFMVKIKNIDLKNIDYDTKAELNYVFKTTPVLVFEDQELTPEEHLKVCRYFDNQFSDISLNPFVSTQIPNVPQIAVRGKGNTDLFGLDNVPISISKPFKYNRLWHQDVVGVKNQLPPVVSSMYMLKVPNNGGATLFSSLENAYENIPIHDRIYYDQIQCLYSTLLGLKGEIDHTGYGRLDRYWEEKITKDIEENMTTQPLVVYSSKDTTKKTLMLTPNKLYQFVNHHPLESHDQMRYMMKNFVLTKDNVGSLDYKEKDLVIFNNRRVMHTGSPTAEYDERILTLLFLATKCPYVPVS